MNNTPIEFSVEAEEMHAGAAGFVTQAERDEYNAWLDEVAGSVPDPQE
jgi:hypothetical protein